MIFAISNPGVPIARPESPPWCKCGVCVPMPDPDENKCCGRVLCVTSYQVFDKICIDWDALKLQIMAKCDLRAEPMEFIMNAYRKAGYQQFALWKYGKLGTGNRRSLPLCVLTMIRKAYPSPDDVYMGFKYH